MKNKYLLLALVLAVVFSFVAFNSLPVFAQEGGGGAAEDKCAGVTCSEKTLNCPDNFVAKCMPTCDPATGACRTCDPDCSGHQGAPPTEEKPSEKICSPGELKCDNIDLKRCSGDGLRWEFVESCKYGCDQGKLACNPAPEEGVRCGSIVCPIGHVCANPGRNLCCPPDMPMECNGRCVRSMDECGPKPPSFCGNRYCEGGEDEYNCPQDCPRKAEPQPQPQPPSYIPEGCREEIDERGNRRVVCERRTEEMCPSQEKVERMKKDCMSMMIEGKRGNPIMERDERGCSIMMRCDLSGGGTGSWLGEKKCPSQEERDKVAKECSSRGARAVMREDFNGCLIVDCVGEMKERPLEFKMCSPEDERAWKDCEQRGGRPQSDPSSDRSCEKYTHCEMPDRGFCPIDQEVIDKKIQEAKKSCMEKGGNPVQMIDNMNCNYIYCAEHGEEVEKICPSPEDKRRAKEECKSRGPEWYHAPGFDDRGCEIVECFQSGPSGARPPEAECKRNVPQEAFSNCEMRGGEFIIRNDERGCVVYANCIMRGDERRIEYTEIKEIPSVATLLNTALKLEALKIEFDKLAKKVEGIAAYYESEGNEEDAKIFRTVFGMIVSVQNKIDEIKGKIRARAKSATMDDITEIIHDIRYLKEVALPDIIYVMMGGDVSETGAIPGESEEAGAEVPEGAKDCKDDGFCFMLNLRTCQKVRFTPEGEGMEKPVVTIEGIEGNNCKIIVKVKSQMAEASMTCLYPNYATGMKGPEDLLPYCEGDLVEMMKMGPPRGGGGPSEEPEMMGCEKVERGINPRGVCGNGCCEDQFGENPQRCPMDCMGGTGEGGCWCVDNGRCEHFECKGRGGCKDCGGTASCICEDDGMCMEGECPGCIDCRGMGGPAEDYEDYGAQGGGPIGPQGPMGRQGQMPREEYREPMPREEYGTPGPSVGGGGGYVSESNPQPSPGPSAVGGGGTSPGDLVGESNPQPLP